MDILSTVVAICILTVIAAIEWGEYATNFHDDQWGKNSTNTFYTPSDYNQRSPFSKETVSYSIFDQKFHALYFLYCVACKIYCSNYRSLRYLQ